MSAADRDALDRFPDVVDVDELRRYFAITDTDRSDIVERRYGPAARLAAGLQLGALRLLGFVPADLTTAPDLVIDHIARQVDATRSDLARYSTRAKTRYEHVEAAEHHVGLRRIDRGDLKVLGDWLVERAMEHDRPIVLFRLACEFLRSERLVRPGATTVERAVIAARTRAAEETHRRIAPQLVGLHGVLDELRVVDPELEITPLVWLRRAGPTENAATIKEQLAKIERLRAVGAGEIDLSRLNPNRVRHLAGVGRRMNPQAIARPEPMRRHQILAATVVETYTERIDEVLDLFDLAVAGVEHNARVEHSNRLEANATIADDTVRVFSTVAGIVLDHEIPDDQVRATILDAVGTDKFAVVTANAAKIVRPQPGYLDLIVDRYARVRGFAPHVLESFRFHGPDQNDPLLQAIRLLADLNATGTRRVPDNAPVGFATPRWRRLIVNEDGSIDRHTWELAVLIELRGALRGANIWVEHSRRYRNPTSYLLPDDDWQRLRPETTTATDISLDSAQRLEELTVEMNEHLDELDAALDDASAVRIDDGKLVVTPLPAQDSNPQLESIRTTVDDLLPQIDLVDLLVEVNEWCGFLDRLTHADNATDRSADHPERLLAAIVAHGCNHGIDKMARISGFTPDQLAWTNNWYLRTNTVRAANDTVANYQLAQPIARSWGDGTLSSSDGQRFPINVKTPRDRRNRRYFTGTGATIYTWTSDRHAQYGTRVIPTTVREATYVLDAIFDNETNVEIEEHTTDTAGYTDLVFGLFDLTGLRFSPRIRDLADQRLWRLPGTINDGPAAQLLEHPIRTDRIEARWDDMLRVEVLDELQVPGEVGALEARVVAAVVILVEIVEALDLAAEEAAAQWTVCDEPDAELADRIENLIFRVMGPQRVLGLDGGDWMGRVGAPDRLRCGLGQAEMADLAFGDEFGHRPDRLLDRDRAVHTVLVVEVDVLDAEPLERSFAYSAHVLWPAVDADAAIRLDDVSELRRQHYPVAAVGDRRADKPLVGVWPIHVSRVQQRDTQIQGAVDRRQRIVGLARLLERQLASIAARHELTLGDWEALSALQRSGPPWELSPKDLAEMIGVTSGTMSVRIERLTRSGLIEPGSARTDGRSRPIRLTEHGRQCWRAATAERTAIEQQLLGSSLSARELKRLNPLLAKLLAQFESAAGPAPVHGAVRADDR